MEVERLSVSHPLAADDPNEAARSDANTAGHERIAGPEARTETATSGSESRSILPERVLPAPEHLGLETRLEFRETAAILIDRITSGTGRLVVDCSGLKSIDSSGLNALILIQRRAAKRRIHVALRQLDNELLALLVLTKLDDLFEIQDGRAH